MFRYAIVLIIGALLSEVSASGQNSATWQTNALEIKAVTFKGQPAVISHGKVRLKPTSEDIAIFFGPNTNVTRPLRRMCYKLEGFDSDWHIGGGKMFLIARFYNDGGDLVSKNEFEVDGDSANWQYDLNKSPLAHRRETVIVPPGASHWMIVISSAGPASTMGIYVVDDLIVSKFSSDNEPNVLLRFPEVGSENVHSNNLFSNSWVRDGTTPSMAKTVELGQNPAKPALEILDDDPIGHAEWHSTLESVPRVKPGDRMVIEWNEMFSIGESALAVGNYSVLPPGKYLFRAAEFDLMGKPTGVETQLNVVVAQFFWKTLWFWGIFSLFIAIVILCLLRYAIRARMRRAMLRLEKQRMLEQERLRIARDIHDDLGARVTQISMVSALAYNSLNDAKDIRGDLQQISEMSRELVTALYETVWAVDPENDNLKELGIYLFQLTNEFCERGNCRCRFQSDNLPREINVASQIRHYLCMAVKEAIHNVIKHSKATEVKVRVEFVDSILTILIQDDGYGFDMSQTIQGHGLNNMRRRLNEIGGHCSIASQPGQGTTVTIQLEIKLTQVIS